MALVSIEEIQTRENRLFEAFDEPFRKSLEVPRKEIQELLAKWVKSIPQIDNRIDNVFDIQSRIKGIDTFKEKIHRKNYIFDWDVYDEKEANQEIICQKLPDLIGIRINCYFAAYELFIYTELKSALENGKIEYVDNIIDEKTEQKNGHIIYKLSGRFKEKYHFEVQIKAIVHNVWGEVEHKTIYKNPCYDGYIHKKKELSEALHEVLFASDSQLLSIFQMNESEDTLIRALFYLYTKNDIEDACRTRILANHYENYFNSFDNINTIKEFVSKRMTGQPFTPANIESQEASETVKRIIDYVKLLFPRFYINSLYQIDKILHIHESYDSFLVYFIKTILSVDEIDDEEIQNNFGEDEEDIESREQEESDNVMFKNYIININEKLGKCIKSEKIEETFKS